MSQALAADPTDPVTPADPTAWVTDGNVYAVAHGAGRTFIGGNFTHVGPRTGVGAPLDGSSGAVTGSFPEIAGGQVYAAVPDGNNGWFIGGDFTSVGGDKLVKNFAHIKSDGSVDDVFKTANVNGPVRAIVVGGVKAGGEQWDGTQVDENVVYLGGEFTQVRGSNRAHAAALRPDGSLVTNWNPAPTDNVYALAETYINQKQKDGTTVVSEPLVFTGGAFEKAGSQSTPLNAHLTPIWGADSIDPEGVANGGQNLAWAPISYSAGKAVRAIALGPVQYDATKVYVPVYWGSDVSTGAALGARQFSALTAAAADTSTPPKYSRASWAVQSYTGWPSSVECRAEVTPCAASVRALALTSDRLYVGGEFGKIGSNNVTRLGVVGVVTNAINQSSPGLTIPSAWTPAADNTVRSLTVGADGIVYAAGDFNTINTASRFGLAAINAAGATPDWDPKAAGGKSNVVTAAGGKVYAGGNFTSLGSQPVSRLAALDANGVLDPNWTGRADDGPVHALALSPDESTLYAGGGFTKASDKAGQKERNHIAAFSTSDGTVQPWAPNLNGWALAIEPLDSTVYVGGSFTKVGDAERSRVAQLNASDGAPTDWNPVANDTVRAIDVSCGLIYLGGSFGKVGGQDRGRIAAVRTEDGLATAWDPGDLGVVYAIVHSGDNVYVGGGFSLMGGAIRPGIADVSAATGKSTSWNPVAESPAIVRALALSPDGGTVYAAGSFIGIGGADRGRIAAIGADGKAITTFNPSADTPAYALATSGSAVYVGGTFRQLGATMQQGFGSFGGAGASIAAPQPLSCAGVPVPPAAPPQDGGGGATNDGSSPQARLPRLRVRHFRVKPPRFRVAVPNSKTSVAPTAKKKKFRFPFGSSFVFDLSRKAKVRISIHRELAGRRKGKECLAPGSAKHGKSCTRYQLYATLKPRNGRAGRNIVAFTGMFKGKPLPAAIYTAKLVATISTKTGKRSVKRLARFQVIKPVIPS